MNSLEDDRHVYFFFRETAVEHINCGKVRERGKKVLMLIPSGIKNG